jgi:hypothetical protein
MKKYRLFLFLSLIIFSNYMSSYAFDNTGDWGINLKNWILSQASGLAIAIVVIIMIPLIYKRAWSKLIGTIFASEVALYFVNNPETLSTIGTTLYKIVFDK